MDNPLEDFYYDQSPIEDIDGDKSFFDVDADFNDQFMLEEFEL